MTQHIPEIYGTIFKFLTQKQLIEIVKQGSSALTDISLLYYPWDLNWRVCKVLSESDINVLMKNEGIDRQELFNCCVEKGLLNKVKILLKDPLINPSSFNNRAILDASYKGYHQIAKLLLDWTPKSYVIGRSCNEEMVDPSDRDNIAILKASASGYNKVVKLLLDWRGPEGERVYSSVRNDKAIKDAYRNGHYEVVKLLANSPEIQYESSSYLLNIIYYAYRSK